MLDYRVAIETGAAILAAERAHADDLDRLDELVEKMAAAEEFEDYGRADVRFHIGVAEASRSPRLVTAMTEVQGDMSGLISLIPHPEEVLARSNDQHRALVRLLRKGDASGGRRAGPRAHRGHRAHPRRADLSGGTPGRKRAVVVGAGFAGLAAADSPAARGRRGHRAGGP